MTIPFPENSNVTPQNEAEQLVFDFLTQMGPTLDDFKRDYRERMSEDVIWDNVGFPVIEGRDACIAHRDTLKELTGMEYCTIEIYNMASSGNVVLTERLDTMYREDDSVILPYRIMGALEVRDGKICRYTDYFDTVPTREAFPHLFDQTERRVS
jgi:limonene-1,2-epoxide hydrolase